MLYLDKLFIILMKKLLYAAMLLLGVGIMAVSCKKDNSENYENAILGEWAVVKVETYENGKLTETFTPTDKQKMSIIFNKNGKITTMEYYNGETDSYTDDYSISGKMLTVDGDSMEIKKLTKTELVLYLVDGNDELRYYFKRVK